MTLSSPGESLSGTTSPGQVFLGDEKALPMEKATMRDDYRLVEVILRKTPDVPGKAIYVKGIKPPHYEAWIPRSLIHGGDMLKIERTAKYGDVVSFRLAGWKAEQVGFV